MTLVATAAENRPQRWPAKTVQPSMIARPPKWISSRFRQALQAGREVRRFAGYGFGIAAAFSNKITNNDLARGNTDTRLQRMSIADSHIIDHLDSVQSCPYRPFRLILVRLRPTEIS